MRKRRTEQSAQTRQPEPEEPGAMPTELATWACGMTRNHMPKSWPPGVWHPGFVARSEALTELGNRYFLPAVGESNRRRFRQLDSGVPATKLDCFKHSA